MSFPRPAGWSLAILIATAAPAPPAGGGVVLKGEHAAVAVEPETLGVTLTPDGGPPLPVSAPRPAPVAVAGLATDASSARWRLPAEGVAVDIKLEPGDMLAVRFVADKAGQFTWPELAPDPSRRAYLLPMFEGRYVPADDAEWGAFFENKGGMDTTAELTMPFWGVDFGGRTLTYLLTNAFNNELALRPENGRLGGRLTHRFTPNQKIKEFGYRIHVGGSSPVEPANIYRRELVARGEFVSLRQKIEKTPDAAKLLGAAHVYLWGDGLSPDLLGRLAGAGLDRLWLGVPDWKMMRAGPAGVRRAVALGYVVGPYDSYHSIHAPGEEETWETAQFDRALFETGPVVRWDGSNKPGFKQKGFALSPLAARPYLERRVTALMGEFQCNSWFMDCDAFGEVYDDYSPLHPATQAEDAAARVARLEWIRDTFKVVVGSEGGTAFAAKAIHFGHGVMTPVVGWGDPDLKDRNSPYFLGAYYPPEAPAVLFKQVPMKPQYRRAYADPRFRLPLYEVVFHDSVVATHHWSGGSLKYDDPDHARELLELLYNVPPLYHLNAKEWAAREAEIKAHYAFFSPPHREAGLAAMTDFRWLTPDRLVQRTAFAGGLELLANFGDHPFPYDGISLPKQSLTARNGGVVRVYSPGASAGQ